MAEDTTGQDKTGSLESRAEQSTLAPWESSRLELWGLETDCSACTPGNSVQSNPIHTFT